MTTLWVIGAFALLMLPMVYFSARVAQVDQRPGASLIVLGWGAAAALASVSLFLYVAPEAARAVLVIGADATPLWGVVLVTQMMTLLVGSLALSWWYWYREVVLHLPPLPSTRELLAAWRGSTQLLA
jgi:hypothetical protein